MVSVLPAWIDQVPDVDYGREKELLERLEAWAESNGWTVSRGDALPYELRQRTDVLFESPGQEDHIRLAVLPKSRKGTGTIRLDSSALRTLELVYWPKRKSWRVWAGEVPIEDDVTCHDWRWLTKRLLEP